MGLVLEIAIGAALFVGGALVGRFLRRYEIEGHDYVMVDGIKITNPEQIELYHIWVEQNKDEPKGGYGFS